nr:hypothetical protein [Tanacetum cinerariifolium]
MEPTIVPLVALTTTSKALWDTLATTTIVTPTIVIGVGLFANGASDDSDRPNKKMKMKIKVTTKMKALNNKHFEARNRRNQSLPVCYANGASDNSDFNLPNKKMKMKMKMIKVTPKKKVDEYTPPHLGDLDLLHLHLLVGAVEVVGGAIR